MNNNNSSLDARTIRKRRRTMNPGSVINARTRSDKRKRIQRGLDTRSMRKIRKMETIQKMHKANPKNRKEIVYPKVEDKVLVIEKKYLDMIFARIKTLECRSNPIRYLNKGDILFLQEKNKPDTIRGYTVFEGCIEFESQIHFQNLSNGHRVFDKTLQESGYKFAYIFSKPHEYDEVLECESTGQQRKIIRVV